MMAAYAVLIGLTVGLFSITPTGFIPAQDQGYFLTVIQLPPGSSLERTDEELRNHDPVELVAWFVVLLVLHSNITPASSVGNNLSSRLLRVRGSAACDPEDP